MHAIVFERPGKPLVVQDVPVPEIGADDVLLEVKASGVCYTDLRLIDGGDRGEGGGIIPGHESVGVIAATGANVGDELKWGDRVAAHALFSCGECDYCLRGEQEACVLGFSRLAGFGLDGGYAEYLRVPADHVVPLPDGIDFADAAPFCCAGLTVYSGDAERGHRGRAAGRGDRDRRARAPGDLDCDGARR